MWRILRSFISFDRESEVRGILPQNASCVTTAQMDGSADCYGKRKNVHL